ncbi:sigma factor [Streptomyces piniterrae]|uniref:sigma factor n=1 Tax=Streptomyces piniterrae TaxID=2571125 RepID=UPI001FEAA16E|nr:sigma factor [Streptomyces piniterrae]
MPDALSATEKSAADTYAALYEREHPRLVGYACSLTSDAWLAEDLVAEAHFRVWRRIQGGYRIDGRIGDGTGRGDQAGDQTGDWSGDWSGDRTGDWSGDWTGDWTGDIPAYLRATIRDLAASTDSTAPLQRTAYVALLARVLDQLPQRWVKALWLAEVEDQSLSAIAKAFGTGKGATSLLLQRAREGLRQAFLRAMPGAPADPACITYWERIPVFIGRDAGADAPQGHALDGAPDGHAPHGVGLSQSHLLVQNHVPRCPECRDRAAQLTRADRRRPALTGPALLAFLAGGSGSFLLPLVGYGAAYGGGLLKDAQRSVRHLMRGRVSQAGPVALTVAGVGIGALVGAAVAGGLALTGDDTAAAGQRAVAPVADGQTAPGGGGEAGLPAAPFGTSGDGAAPGAAPGTPSLITLVQAHGKAPQGFGQTIPVRSGSAAAARTSPSPAAPSTSASSTGPTADPKPASTATSPSTPSSTSSPATTATTAPAQTSKPTSTSTSGSPSASSSTSPSTSQPEPTRTPAPTSTSPSPSPSTSTPTSTPTQATTPESSTPATPAPTTPTAEQTPDATTGDTSSGQAADGTSTGN